MGASMTLALVLRDDAELRLLSRRALDFLSAPGLAALDLLHRVRGRGGDESREVINIRLLALRRAVETVDPRDEADLFELGYAALDRLLAHADALGNRE